MRSPELLRKIFWWLRMPFVNRMNLKSAWQSEDTPRTPPSTEQTHTAETTRRRWSCGIPPCTGLWRCRLKTGTGVSSASFSFHRNISSNADEPLALTPWIIFAELTAPLSEGAQSGLQWTTWPCKENHPPYLEGPPGCVWGAWCLHFNAVQHCPTRDAPPPTHPRPGPHRGCHGPQQVNFKQTRNDGWQQAGPETRRKFIHGAEKVLWHGREGGRSRRVTLTKSPEWPQRCGRSQ